MKRIASTSWPAISTVTPCDVQRPFRTSIASWPPVIDAILVDGQAVLRDRHPRWLLDDYLFNDGMHPSFEGQVALAEAILAGLREHQAFGWPASRPAPVIELADCARHFDVTTATWKEVCRFAAGFYRTTLPIRFDPAERAGQGDSPRRGAAAARRRGPRRSWSSFRGSGSVPRTPGSIRRSGRDRIRVDCSARRDMLIVPGQNCAGWTLDCGRNSGTARWSGAVGSKHGQSRWATAWAGEVGDPGLELLEIIGDGVAFLAGLDLADCLDLERNLPSGRCVQKTWKTGELGSGRPARSRWRGTAARCPSSRPVACWGPARGCLRSGRSPGRRRRAARARTMTVRPQPGRELAAEEQLGLGVRPCAASNRPIQLARDVPGPLDQRAYRQAAAKEPVQAGDVGPHVAADQDARRCRRPSAWRRCSSP